MTVVEKKQPLLSGKLHPPSLRNVLTRPRLIELANIEHKRLINICAGPGYGKTTLMAQLVEKYEGPKIWYQVDYMDQDPAVFLRHLIVGFAAACDGAGERSLSRMADATNIETEGENILAVLLDEVREKSTLPIRLCIDDYHLIDECKFASKFLHFIFRHLPEDSTIVLTSRSISNLHLGRIRSLGSLQDITEDELRFKTNELNDLLAEKWDLNISLDVVKQLHDLVDGWAAGLVLTEGYIRAGNDIQHLMERKLVKRNVFDYLAEEIFEIQSKEMCTVLMCSSLIDPIDTDLLQDVIGVHNVKKIIREAVDSNLFTFRMESMEEFRFHPLFKNFLSEKIESSMSPSKLKTLRCKLAESALLMKKYDVAIQLYLEGGESELAADLIQEKGFQAIRNGEFQKLLYWVNSIPDEIRSNRPWIYFYSAMTHERIGKMKIAKDEYLRARAGFQKSNDKKGLYQCAHEISFFYFFSEEQKACVSAAEEALLQARNSDELIKAKSAAASLYLWLGRILEAKNLWQEADDLCNGNHDDVWLKVKLESFASLYVSGKFNMILSQIDNLSSCSKQSQLMNESAFFNNQANVLYLNGQYKKALENINKAISLDRLRGDVLGEHASFDTLGQILIGLGDVNEGRKYIELSIDKSTSAVSFGSEQMNHLGSSYRRNHEFFKALDYHKRALSDSEVSSNLYALAMSYVNIGNVKNRIEIDSGTDDLQIALSLAMKYGFDYVKTQVHFCLAWRALQLEDERVAREEMSACLILAEKNGHNHFILQEGKISLSLLTLAYEYDIERLYLLKIFEGIGRKALSEIAVLFKSGSSEVRKAAIYAASAAERDLASPYFKRLTKDVDHEVRKIASEELKKVTLKSRDSHKILTHREAQIFKALAQGMSNADMAASFFISPRTVKTHMTNIFRKLGFSNRTQAVAYYHQSQFEDCDAAKNSTFDM